MQAGSGDDHGLRPAADLALGIGDEVVDYDLHLLLDGVRMNVHERPEQVVRLALVVARVFLDLLDEPPVDLVRRVALQHVADEPLLDCLPHAVEMEGRERPVGLLVPEEFERLGLRRGGECEGRYVGEMPALLHLREDRVVEFLLRRLSFRLVRLGLFKRLGGEHGLEALGALARLGRVRLVDDQGEPPARKLADLLGDHRELLERGDDYGLAAFQRVLQLPGRPVDVLYDPQRLLELAHGALELAVEHAPVRDHDNRVEHAAVVGVVQC